MLTIRVPSRPLWQQVQISLMTIVGCAWLYSTIFRESFDDDLIYAFFIVLLAQIFIASGRYAWRYATARTRPPHDPGHAALEPAWPGWQWMVPWIIVSVVAAYFLGEAIGNMLMRHPGTLVTMKERTRMVSLSIVLALVPALCITYFYYAKSRLSVIELRAEAALRSAAESQLKLLESQLEPHMLFNTLANLRVLMAVDSARAQGMLDRLIAYLRATLDASRVGMHSLQSEFNRLSDYLELMTIRMGPRLTYQFDLPTDLASLPCPPLLLQPLVENAIKHGLEPQVKGGRIVVTAKRDHRALVLRVRDTGAGLDAQVADGTRFGLQQVRERLAALYGAAGTLLLAPAMDDEGGTIVTVSLPFPEGKSS